MHAASAQQQENVPSAKRLLITITAFVCSLYGVFCFIVYFINFSKQPGQDWMVYYMAARAYLNGHPSLTYDGTLFTAHMNEYFSGWLAKPLSFHPWLYPPSFLILLIPFALLSFGLSYIVFQLITFVALLVAVAIYTRDGYRRSVLFFSLIFAPAVSFTVGTGQNAFLTTALIVAGFGLLERQPVAAGILLGLVTYKPQLWLMVPIALIAARQWRALAGAFASASGMVLVSLVAFGIEPWQVWLEWMFNAPADIYETWLKWGRLHGESIYANLALLGAPHVIAATTGQPAVAILAAFCVWRTWWQGQDRDLQLIVLLGATILAAPHVTNYDTVLLVVASTLLFIRSLEGQLQLHEVIISASVWMIQLFNPPSAFRIGLVTPIITFLLIVCAMARLRKGRATEMDISRRGFTPAVPASH